MQVLRVLMLRFLTVSIVLAGPVSLASISRAQTQAEVSAEAVQVATELMGVLSKDMIAQMSAQMIAQVWPTVQQQLRTARPEIDTATLAELRSEFERLQLDYLKDVMKGAPAVYAKYFSAQELRDMLAFYRTPTGEKSLKVLPQVMSEFFASLMPRLQEVEQKTTEAFRKILRDKGYMK
jgi:hypothetical protein